MTSEDSKLDERPIVTVFGATGQQGGSVVTYLLEDGNYRVRGVTRNKDSDKAKALTARGVEVVQANQHDEADRARAFDGAYGAFLVTSFWDPQTRGHEAQLGRDMADSAKKAGIKHLFWSTLPDVEKHSNGKWQVPFFSDKAKTDYYLREIGVPTTFIVNAFFYQNYSTFLAPVKQDDGSFLVTFPMRETSPLAMGDPTQTGAAVVAALKDREKYLGEYLFLVGQNSLPGEFFNEDICKQLGVKVNVKYITPEEFAKKEFDGAKEIAHMYGWYDEFGYGGPDLDVDSGKKAVPELRTFSDYIKHVNLKFE